MSGPISEVSVGKGPTTDERLEMVLAGCAEVAEASAMYWEALIKARAVAGDDYLLADRQSVEKAIAFGVEYIKRFLERWGIRYEQVYGYETGWRILRFCVKVGGVTYAVEGGKRFGGPYYGLVLGRVSE
jgi:hypothetical protein